MKTNYDKLFLANQMRNNQTNDFFRKTISYGNGVGDNKARMGDVTKF